MPGRLRVNEVYVSVQGESTRAGLPCAFVRLTGCHLRCTYCDTPYAFYNGTWITVPVIVDQLRSFGVPLVEITGGEPLLQPGCADLAAALLDAGFTVLCETAGALPIDRLPPGVVRIMDLKCPSSGEEHRNHWPNIELLESVDEVKFVIGDRHDYEWSRNILSRHRLAERCTVLMSPVFGVLAPAQLVAWILDDRLPVRFQLQVHKFIWSPTAAGV